MVILEKDVEGIIYNSTIEELKSHGLDFISSPLVRRYRQLDLGLGGRADLVYVERMLYPMSVLRINVIELKKDETSPNTLIQAFRYCHAIQSYMAARNIVNYEMQVILIGNKIKDQDGVDDDSFWCVPSLLKGKYPVRCGLNDFLAFNYDMSINGLTFHRQDIGLCCDAISDYMYGVAEKQGKVKTF